MWRSLSLSIAVHASPTVPAPPTELGLSLVITAVCVLLLWWSDIGVTSPVCRPVQGLYRRHPVPHVKSPPSWFPWCSPREGQKPIQLGTNVVAGISRMRLTTSDCRTPAPVFSSGLTHEAFASPKAAQKAVWHVVFKHFLVHFDPGCWCQSHLSTQWCYVKITTSHHLACQLRRCTGVWRLGPEVIEEMGEDQCACPLNKVDSPELATCQM